MKRRFGLLSILMATLLVTGCGSDGDAPPASPAAPATGVFLDSPVGGIGYRTATRNGLTNAAGEYSYLPGETVTFFIGDLEFPPVIANGVVTPADMAEGNATRQTNMLQLLQTLDDDGNPGNGIAIHADAATAFAGKSLDLSSAAFDTDVTAVLAGIGAGLALVAEDAANAHFDASQKNQLLGSWLYSEGTGKRNVLTFLDGNRYLIIHEHADAPGEPGSQSAGSVEYGEYTWNTANGTFEATLIGESDGWGGLYDNGSTVTRASVRHNTLTLHVTDGGGADVAFTRVTSATSARVGAYVLSAQGDEDDLHVLTFLSDSDYVIAHTKNGESYHGRTPQPLSGEFGTYRCQGTAFTALGASVDTDGVGGLYNAMDPDDQRNETLTLTATGLDFTDDDEGTFRFTKLAPGTLVP